MEYKNIVKVDKNGLYYKDEYGLNNFIDFEYCKNRFVNYIGLQKNVYIGNTGLKTTKQMRCMA
ncbi:hypothetical protein OB236_15595 [Paenibacillus sp. WQ 127069]|uniref:Uncharacterized protein n=1 Tax=Paenibacillus baimaensis TaxID=2982185 RepID=A0ABT2UFX7_9BACL|nr:hypothetical protein [Paenibacillus sp. WQ 127069]MCU6793528.1 hypothetical protein [Paenibacillus sp. WQ 127069]